jgi:hypothetical protein
MLLLLLVGRFTVHAWHASTVCRTGKLIYDDELSCAEPQAWRAFDYTIVLMQTHSMPAWCCRGAMVTAVTH